MSAGSSRFLVLLALVACNEPLAPPHPKHKDAAVAQRDAAPPIDSAPAIDAAPPDAAAEVTPYYGVAAALEDLRASPLKHIGTGAWPGNASIKGCAYRNDRVLVVDVYCTHKEQPAFSVVVIKPDAGAVTIYAEADKPVSEAKRAEYISFRAESDPRAAIQLTATFDELTLWYQKMYDERILQHVDICSTELPTCPDATWLEWSKAFVKDPPAAWASVITELRKRAKTDAGKH